MSKEPAQCKVLSPTAILGYGFPRESFLKGIQAGPDLIAVDGGSTDPGPYYLGSGKPFTNRVGVKRDLRYMLVEGRRGNIPVVVGTSGGSGAAPHVNWCREIVEEIAAEENLSFRLGVIYADIEPERVIAAVRRGQVEALPGLPPLTEETVRASVNVVAQMGVEPFVRALDEGCDVILAGRAYDPCAFAALPIRRGYDPGPALHLGKILECAAIAAEPGSGSDSVLGVLRRDSFLLKPLNPVRRFTKESTAAHSLYEKSDPYFLPGPGGRLDLRGVSFIERGNGEVEVTGSRFEESEKYFIKLEAVRKVGCRTISMAGTRDPVMIRKIDSILAGVNERVADILDSEGITGRVYFHLYGKDGVMGSLEPEKKSLGHELGILIESVSDSQEGADTICSITRSTLLHHGYPGRISTAGNLAFPFSPSDIPPGEVYEFSIYHLMEIDSQDIFPLEVIEI